MRKQGPKVGKSFLADYDWPKLFLQTRGKPASHLCTLDHKLNVPRVLRTLGRRKRMLRQGPEVGKGFWLV